MGGFNVDGGQHGEDKERLPRGDREGIPDFENLGTKRRREALESGRWGQTYTFDNPSSLSSIPTDLRTDTFCFISSATRLLACVTADSPTPYAAPISLSLSPV